MNSARGRIASPPDLLPDFPAFARWCELQHLDPAGAEAFPKVIEFRSRLSEMAEALQDGVQPPGGAIAALNDQLGQINGTRRLTRVAGEWRLEFIASRPLGALQALARSAASTLAESRMAVRRCAGETCSLFFSFDSRIGSRHWCDPNVCGRTANIERRRGAGMRR